MALKEATIAGGGLAGLALGIALRQQSVPVTLLEAGAYPRHRVCGEFVSGIQPDSLAQLGVHAVLGKALRPRETVWFDGDAPMFRATLPEPAYGISRHFLDQALADRLLELGGTLRTGDRFLGDFSAEGLIQATGRALQKPARGLSPWMGLKGHYANLECEAELEVHLANGAYVGVTAVEAGWTNVTGLFPEGLGAGSDQNVLEHAVAAAGLARLAERLRRARLRAGSMKGVSRLRLGWQPGFGSGLRIGDAAAMIAPVTGNGMTMALQGALLAVEPVVQWSRGAWSWERTVREVVTAQKREFAWRLRWAGALQRLLMRPAGRRLCATALKREWVSFDTLYRLVR